MGWEKQQHSPRMSSAEWHRNDKSKKGGAQRDERKEWKIFKKKKSQGRWISAGHSERFSTDIVSPVVAPERGKPELCHCAPHCFQDLCASQDNAARRLCWKDTYKSDLVWVCFFFFLLLLLAPILSPSTPLQSPQSAFSGNHLPPSASRLLFLKVFRSQLLSYVNTVFCWACKDCQYKTQLGNSLCGFLWKSVDTEALSFSF